MTQHAKKSDHLQLVDVPRTTIVEIPLPLLGAVPSENTIRGGSSGATLVSMVQSANL